MSPEMILRSPPVDRRQPLLARTSKPSRKTSKCLAEAAGVTTAGCAAVCCLPVGVVAILFLAVYKVPAKLCRRAIRTKKRRRLLKKGTLSSSHGCECGFDEVHTMSCSAGQIVDGTSLEMDKDVMELEKEMWDRFYGTGFWRSLSQREG
ncbi:Pollen preferential protein [Heracleum sosnowskyi]|uniref:Pollen preferential protein n=1 Tax=Heracleum sosnowskyi TaxID=360622 RepID=A0AAD8MZW4_9APIA|nr:Pollen preferential protein [Heracleum sosnowskyi]